MKENIYRKISTNIIKEKSVKNNISFKNIKTKLDNIMNIRVIIALNYLKEFFMCKYFYYKN